MCPGVGKTYAMLEAAQRELKAGVIWSSATSKPTAARKPTRSLAGLPIIPAEESNYRGMRSRKWTWTPCWRGSPQLALVDELAHTMRRARAIPNAGRTCRNCSTPALMSSPRCNVQHVESRADTVRQITGAEIRETVPDSVLDTAEIELIDLPPAELIAAAATRAKFMCRNAPRAAAQNFFREANLTALRELALRLVADHVGEDTQEFHRAQTDAGPVENRTSPAGGRQRQPVFRTAHPLDAPHGGQPEMPAGWPCTWKARARWTKRAKARLEKNLALARTLGAEVIATTDEDLVRGLLRIAQQQNVSQIIVGKPAGGESGWNGCARGQIVAPA